jgi:predicted nucleic acid-binding protein
MSNLSQILVDSDAFIALFVESDAHYERVGKALQRLLNEPCRLVTTNVIVAETATWLSRRVSQDKARQFLDYIEAGHTPIFYIDKVIQQHASELFRQQPTKNISLFDCLNVAVIQLYNLPGILSFDKFYIKFNIPMVA